MSCVVMVAAEALEFRGLLRRLRTGRLDLPVAFARSAVIGGRPAVLVANGAGVELAGNAVDAAASRGKVDILVSAGFCGALDPVLQAGDVFVATQVVSLGEQWAARLPRTAYRYRSGSMISIDRVIGSTMEKRRLRESGVGAVDMEAAAVGTRAKRWGVPFFCIRAVTDEADEGFSLDFKALRSEDGGFDRPRIIGAALRRPWSRVPELCRLAWRSRLASRRLGDFLAHCEF